MNSVIEIDGEGLSVEELMRIGYKHAKIQLSSAAWEAVQEGRQVIDDILS
jgi:histidine ammonia-lyase